MFDHLMLAGLTFAGSNYDSHLAVSQQQDVHRCSCGEADRTATCGSRPEKA